MIKNINKANELIKQTEKEALEIIKKREFIKSKIVDNSIAIDFIIDCRSGEPNQYDIVIGAMANDRIYNYVSDYIDGAITREQFWVLAKFKYPTHQINFCTREALKCLEYRGYEETR